MIEITHAGSGVLIADKARTVIVPWDEVPKVLDGLTKALLEYNETSANPNPAKRG